MDDWGKIKAPRGLFVEVDREIRRVLCMTGRVVVFVDEWNFRHLAAEWGVKTPSRWTPETAAYQAEINRPDLVLPFQA
jgi:hypothetical protein